MRYHVTIKEEPDELVASIRERVRPDRIPQTMPAAFGRLMDSITSVGMGEGTPGLVMHAIHEPSVADIEVFVPVARVFEPPSGISVTTLPGGTMASTTFVGPYDEIAPAYAALTKWIDEHDRQIIGPPREHYLNDPNRVGIEHAETEIEFPVA